MSCNSTQFPLLSFCGQHEKPHAIRGLSKNCHLRLDPKSGNGKCAIRHISCDCNTWTKMLDKPC